MKPAFYLALLTWIAFLIILFLAALMLRERAPNNGLPMVAADYEHCVKVKTGPVKPPRLNVLNPAVNGEVA